MQMCLHLPLTKRQSTLKLMEKRFQCTVETSTLKRAEGIDLHY